MPGWAFVEETGEGHRLDTVKLKKYVGTERITARRMRHDPVSFRPSHTMVVTTNYRPVVTDTDQGTCRRLRMVPFPRTYGRDGLPVDRDLRSRLMDRQRQQEAVLAWLVEGRAPLAGRRAGVARRVRRHQAGHAGRARDDGLHLCLRPGAPRGRPGSQVEVERLREEFNDWLPAPHKPWGRQTFGQRFAQHEAMRALGAVRALHPSTAGLLQRHPLATE